MHGGGPTVLARILAGERRAIAQAISAVENGAAEAPAIVQALAPHRGRACVLGITGAPGAGKSTLVNAILGELVARGMRVAVHDPYELRELDMLHEKFANLNPTDL